jgi:hypothetical protein
LKLEKRFTGCKKLISYLDTYNETPKEKKKKILDDLFLESDFCSWVKAYIIVPSSENLIYSTLLELDKKQVYREFPIFAEKIREGFNYALEIGSPLLLKKLNTIIFDDSTQLEKLVNRYLPDNTPLSVKLILTIDGFNTGMVRENTIFYSINRVNPETYDSIKLAHELHHIGVNYWFNNDPKWVKWFEVDDSPQKIVAEILRYVVSEGIANLMMSPNAVSHLNSSPQNEAHNERIKYLEKKYVKLLALTEEIVLIAFNQEMEKSRELYRKLSIDETGSGVPAGHYMSAMMFEEILKEHEDSVISEIICNPWRFFNIYNDLKNKSINFKQEFLQLFKT